MIEDDQILQLYVEDSLDHLNGIESDLLAIESAGSSPDPEILNKVFRAAHSIKGGAGFMGMTVIRDLAHHLENVLSFVRDGTRPFLPL